MGKYRAAYKCPLCEALIAYGGESDIPDEKLTELLSVVIKRQQFSENPYLCNAPMYIPHKCRTGGEGLAMFAGFIKLKK